MEEKLQDRIKQILEGAVGVNLFFALKEDGGIVIKRADLQNGDTQTDLKRQFVEMLREEYAEPEEVSVLEMSSADERAHAIYHYDLGKFPHALDYFAEFDCQNSYAAFSFREDDLAKLDAYLIVIGTQERYCVLYHKFYPVYLIGRGGFCLMKSDTRFEKLETDILRIGRNYQFLKVEDDIYIKDLEILEKFGGFQEIILKEALGAIADIEKTGILEEMDGLKETMETNLTFARKLRKIKKTSPVLFLNIPADEIVKFSKTHPGIKGKLRYTEDGARILLTTRKSQEAFLNLLDDSYLTSELTKCYYDSLAKNRADV